MLRLSIVLLAGVLLNLHAPVYASECDPLLEAGQSKKIRFGKDAQKTSLFGAVIGGIGGLIVSGDEEGAAIGAAAGAAVGFVVGQTAEQRRAAFESESEYLDCELEATREEIELREARLEELKTDFDETQAEVEAIKIRIANEESTKKERKDMRNKLKDDIKAYEKEMESLEAQIAFLDEVSSGLTADKQATKAALAKNEELKSEKEKLVAQYETYALMSETSNEARGQMRKPKKS